MRRKSRKRGEEKEENEDEEERRGKRWRTKRGRYIRAADRKEGEE